MTPEVVASSARELLATGKGHLRLPLYVARSREGLLCIGTTGRWECTHPVDVQPVFAFTLQGGRGSIRDFGSIVGLAAPDVRVTVEHLNHEVPLKLRRFPRFGWAAFASPLWMNGAPDLLHFYDRAGHELSGFLDLAFEANPCPPGNDDCVLKGEWHAIGDPVASTPLDERAKRIAFRDELVRRLLAGRRYSFDPPERWSKCTGQRIGVVLGIHIAPATFAEDWPLVDFDNTSHSAYVQRVEYFKVERVTELDVSVDTNEGRVVAVDPTNAAPDAPEPKVNEFSFHPVGGTKPGGGPDNGNCSSPGG